jgi:hypothetical protein
MFYHPLQSCSTFSKTQSRVKRSRLSKQDLRQELVPIACPWKVCAQIRYMCLSDPLW